MSIRKGGQIIAGAPRETGGVEIGDVGIAPFGIDETLNLRRYLNGQIISQSQFVSFTTKLKNAILLYPSLSTTETNWQSEKNLSKLGQCGKFVIDDTAGTIRLPAVVNAQGLTDLALLGAIKSESLPDARYYSNAGWGGTDASNSFVASKGGYEDNNTGKGLLIGSRLDSSPSYDYSYGKLSASNSTYQDNAPVQQEAVQYPYYIQVATGIEETLPAIREYKVNNSDFFGKSMYSDVAPDNASWLVSNGQWNAKSVYPDYYDWLVKQVNAGVNGFVASTGEYTAYDFVINTADQTFRLPLLRERILVEKKVPTDSDASWYNLYSDGWIEQGGTLEAAQATSVLFIKPFTSIPTVTVSAKSNTTTNVGAYTTITNLTLTSFVAMSGGWVNSGILTTADGNVGKVWSAQGYTDIPQDIGWNLYYYVGDTIQDASVINAGAVLGQLANGINRTAKSDRETVVGWGFPDWDTEVQLSGKEYTATYKCWLVSLTVIGGTAEALLYINGKLVTKEYSDYAQLQIPLDVGDVVTSNTPFTGISIYAMKGLIND